MRILLLPALLLLLTPLAKAQNTKPTTADNGYHNTQNDTAKARAGAYSRYDASNRKDEENLKLAPGVRLNMPNPPTTDYMGRPLKKKPAPTTATKK